MNLRFGSTVFQVTALHEEAERQTGQEAQLRALQNKVTTDAKLLVDRAERASKFNKNLESRLALLTLLSDSQPRPLSDKVSNTPMQTCLYCATCDCCNAAQVKLG